MPVKNEEGNRYGRLTAIRQVGVDRCGSALWECSCECGGLKTARGYSLRRGATKSCGCLVKENAWDHPRKHASKEDAAWYFNWNQYKRNVKHRGLDMGLTLKEFREICSLPCFYCDRTPETRPSQRGRASV